MPAMHHQLPQTGRDVPLHAPHRKASLLTIRQEEGNFSPPTAAQPIRDCSGPAHGKPPYSGPPAPPMGSGYHSPAQLPLLPIKARSPSLFSGFACGPPWFTDTELQFLCYSPINSLLLVKQLAMLLLKSTLDKLHPTSLQRPQPHSH